MLKGWLQPGEAAAAAAGTQAQAGAQAETQSKTMKRVWVSMRAGLAGGISGTVSKLVLYPLDTVKKRLQIRVLQNTAVAVTTTTTAVTTAADAMSVKTLNPHMYTNMRDCFHTMYHTEGLAAFYKGLTPTLLKSSISTAITFAAFEVASEMLSDRQKQS